MSSSNDRLRRRSFVAGLVGASSLPLLACKSHPAVSLSEVSVRPLASLPQTSLSWLNLRDHFVCTVGEHAGQGEPLGPLRVLADAVFEPRSRFPMHRHREMEILSIVLEGELSHHGDLEDGRAFRPREAQLISARDGMVHAEGNDTDSPTRMLQIWFAPQETGGPAAYFDRTIERGRQVLIAGEGAMPLRADARVWWLDLEPSSPYTVPVAPSRKGYLMALNGDVHLNGDVFLRDGEGAVVEPGVLRLSVSEAASALWIDVQVV